ncbi:DUF4157 domain-containing protein [Achromobacter arsenitoxydans]|uniref:eCIS core domain-containing protein n=1 Tax=Achromobacter arsenitoxydans SY8 TaxID=477184 RepID=H0FAS5_9BURK|nr:DUF4157 domain-containing protein [Achromobacter arsenitoxydans]EHK64593.1 hypothetical protein KYC_19409 [Achromobacter arsenitoxydans SY8]
MRPPAPLFAPQPDASPPRSRLLQRRCACGCGGKSSCSASPLTGRARRGKLAVPDQVEEVLRSTGEPLAPADRADFEHRYGHDFGRVRIHADARAAASARALSAQAYTVGPHVAFGAGRYAPGTRQGRALLAHELAHVVQQEARYRPGLPLELGPEHSPQEAEADRAANALAHPAATRGTASQTVQRAGMGDLRVAEAEARKCPATHAMPNDVFDAVNEAWSKSGHGEDTVTEHGGRIVSDKDGKRVIRTGSGGGGSISLPAEKKGDYTLGTFHTHPYSKSEKSRLGVSFSGADVANFVAGNQGWVKYVGAGSCNYALNIQDYEAVYDCRKRNVDIKTRWNDAFAAATGTFQEKVETAVRASIDGCGICYYRACRPDAASAVPKSMNLI